MLTLLDLDQKTCDQIVDMITKTIERTSSDSKMHDFTLLFEDLNLGISFLSIWSREMLRQEVVSWGGLKKYKYKKRRWLSLGKAIQDSRFIVNEFCYLNFDWKPDREADALLVELKQSGSKEDSDTKVSDTSQ